MTWSFENKIYYQYELYASKVKDFTPNTFDLIFQGQASSYMFQAKPNEIWYFKVCGINTYGERTEFSNQVEIKGVDTFTKSGKSIARWTSNADGTGYTYLPSQKITMASNLVLYAQWE